MKTSPRNAGRLLVAGLAAVLAVPAWLPGENARARPLSGEAALKEARLNGKYEMLLRQFQAPQDVKTYKDKHDFGWRDVKEHAGQTELPQGYWVYVAPYWFIFRDVTAIKKTKRGWGPEQATGEPDAPQGGDNPKAWASQSADEQDEWLLLEYADPVVPKSILIHENDNPGAVNKVSVFKLDGSEFVVWEGKDPTAPGSGSGVSEIPIKIDFKINRLKIYLDSRNVAGWNEIDAVGLQDKSGKTHWATCAAASSTYAHGAYASVDVEYFEQRFNRLESEIRELKQMNKELRETIKDLKETLKKDK